MTTSPLLRHVKHYLRVATLHAVKSAPRTPHPEPIALRVRFEVARGRARSRAERLSTSENRPKIGSNARPCATSLTLGFRAEMRHNPRKCLKTRKVASTSRFVLIRPDSARDLAVERATSPQGRAHQKTGVVLGERYKNESGARDLFLLTPPM